MKRFLLPCVCLIIFAALSASAQNWPSFRGPGASGVAEGQNPPTTFDAAKSVNVRWKTPIPGLGHSSPIVWGNKVFLTTAVSSDPKPETRFGLYGDSRPSRTTRSTPGRSSASTRRQAKSSGSASPTRDCQK